MMPYILCFHNISGQSAMHKYCQLSTNLIQLQMKNRKEINFTLRLNNEENEMLEKLSKHWETQRSTLIRTLIINLYNQTYEEEQEITK